MSQNDIHTLNMEDKIEEYRTANTGNLLDEQFSIYRVPAHIRKNNESYYEPRMVSIGPYHQGKEHLRAMQDHKWRYLVDYIEEGKGKKEDYIEQIRKMETSIRARYFESFDKDKEKFVETVLLDSCFIIQVFLQWRFKDSALVRNMGWALPLLMGDLTMMENQIPYDVLEKMYNIFSFGCINAPGDLGENQPKLTKFLVHCLHTMYNENGGPDPKLLEPGVNIKHLLHLYYLVFVPHPENITTTVPNSPILPHGCPRTIPRVKELQEFGVTFKKKENFRSFLDISFNNGVLEIPYIAVEESTRTKFLNLIAFEQCRSTDEKHLTSYAVFLACLIDTSEDVIALQKCGIIVNRLANTKEAVKFFHQLRDCAYMDYEDHYLQQVFVDIKHYCQKSWPKYRAMLLRDYFSNPWSIMAFCAASLVLCITIFKTIYFIVTTFF